MKNLPAWSQTVFCEKAQELVSLISSNMQNLGVVVRSENAMTTTILEEDVQQSSVSKIQIQQILKDIEFVELNLNQNLNLEMIEKLMMLYQQAIEYYSALNDQKFQEFLNKLHQLLQREEIQAVLSTRQNKKQKVQKQEQKVERELQGQLQEQTLQQSQKQENKQEQKQEQKLVEKQEVKLEEKQEEKKEEKQEEKQEYKQDQKQEEIQHGGIKKEENASKENQQAPQQSVEKTEEAGNQT